MSGKSQTDLEDDQYQTTMDQKRKLSWNDVLVMVPPPEVQNLIFDRLCLEDKKSARLVCKLWKKFVDETLNFSPLLYDDSVKEVLKFGSTGKDINGLTISGLQKFKYPEKGLGFSNITKVDLIPQQISVRRSKGKKNMLVGISEPNFRRLLEEYSEIKELYLNSAALKDISYPSFLEHVKLNSLEQIKVSTYNLDEGFKVAADFLKNTFPSLKMIDVSILNHEDNLVHTPLYYEECYQFLVRHAKTLDQINMHHCNLIDERSLELFELMIDHGMDQTEYLKLMENIASVKVSSINLTVTHYEGRSRFQFSIQLLKAQTSLTSLKLCKLALANIAVWDIVPEVVRKCSGTLKYLAISGCFCPITDAPKRFSCSCVTKCDQLITLKVDFCGMEITDIENVPKKIEKLNLGQTLTRDQINFITKDLQNLTNFQLPQGGFERQANIPKINYELFKEIVKLPKLTQLTLRKGTCAYKKIRKMISYTPGIQESSAGVELPTYFKLTINRKQFDCNRL